jgi:hypothetical protein
MKVDMKKIFLVACGIWISCCALAQSKNYDSIAVRILDRMSSVIGDLESCSFKLKVANDHMDLSGGLVKYFADYEVYLSGPDKMLVNVHGIYGHRQLMYNGEQLAYYSFDENNYGIVNAPNTLIATFDSLNRKYGIDFPAADFFYPAFTDDLLENSDSIRYLGIETIGGNEYFHIIAYGKEISVQFWINNDAYNLPESFSISYKQKRGNPQYIGLFSDWQINPKLPKAMFNFSPPPQATKVKVLAK